MEEYDQIFRVGFIPQASPEPPFVEHWDPVVDSGKVFGDYLTYYQPARKMAFGRIANMGGDIRRCYTSPLIWWRPIVLGWTLHHHVHRRSKSVDSQMSNRTKRYCCESLSARLGLYCELQRFHGDGLLARLTHDIHSREHLQGLHLLSVECFYLDRVFPTFVQEAL